MLRVKWLERHVLALGQENEKNNDNNYLLSFYHVQGAFFFIFIYLTALDFSICGPLAEACGIQFPDPGVKPRPLLLGAYSLSHWTTREVPGCFPYIFQSSVTDGSYYLWDRYYCASPMGTLILRWEAMYQGRHTCLWPCLSHYIISRCPTINNYSHSEAKTGWDGQEDIIRL